MTATASSSSCHLLLVLRSQPPLPSPSSSSFISFLKPLFLPSSNITLRKFHLLPKNTLFPTFLSTPPSSSRAFSYTPPLSSFIGSSTSKSTEENTLEEEEDDEETDFSEDEFETEKDNFEGSQVVVEDSNSSPLVRQRQERLKVELPSLSVKEKKELGSYAHSLGKKLKTQSVGKSGITPNLVTAFSDNLEANELLKVMVDMFFENMCSENC
jgi:RNA-binding protein